MPDFLNSCSFLWKLAKLAHTLIFGNHKLYLLWGCRMGSFIVCVATFLNLIILRFSGQGKWPGSITFWRKFSMKWKPGNTRTKKANRSQNSYQTTNIFPSPSQNGNHDLIRTDSWTWYLHWWALPPPYILDIWPSIASDMESPALDSIRMNDIQWEDKKQDWETSAVMCVGFFF